MGYYRDLDKYMDASQKATSSMDRNAYKESPSDKLKEPIIPISKLGTTFAEKGASGQGNILQSLQSSIRQGVGQLQLAMQTPTNAQMGGGVASYGKDVRQALKEVIKASEIDWQGLEMPVSSTSNVSGFDPQNRGFSEQKRKTDLQHIKDAIIFNAEIGGGGGVDIWSQEFQRSIHDADFNKNGQFQEFENFNENTDLVKQLVDDRTGQIIPFSTSQLGGQNSTKINVPIWKRANENGVGPNGKPVSKGDYIDAEGNRLDPHERDFLVNRVPDWDPDKSKFKSKPMDWVEFKDYAKTLNKERGTNYSPEEWWYRSQLEMQFAQQRGQSLYHTTRYTSELKELDKLIKSRAFYRDVEKGKTDEELAHLMREDPSINTQAAQMFTNRTFKKPSEIIDASINELKHRMKYTHETGGYADAQAESILENMNHIKPVAEFAKEKTFESYADLGIFALETSLKHKGQLQHDIHVGPELGWPQAYGGHPTEFIEIIQESRKKMVEKMKNDPYYRNKYDDPTIKKLAKKHIAGMLDTSHMSMWYNHFPKDPKNPNESEDSRLKRFNKWYADQAKALGEADVIGGIQIVDSATGDHRHLTPGQGIFPTVQLVKDLVNKYGYNGMIVSEGHEEEMFEPGRIQYETWRQFGANVGSGYGGSHGGGNSINNVYGGFNKGYMAPPNYIVGGYAPSNEWKLWSEVPLE